MTLSEHKLLIAMFSRQAMLIKTLADIVRSHGLLSDDDLKPFNDFVLRSEIVNPHITQTTAETYCEMAARFGLDVPIVRRTT
jgi:hypothetical protein